MAAVVLAKKWEGIAIKTMIGEAQQKTGDELHYIVKHEGPNRLARREADAVLRREAPARKDNRKKALLQRRKNQRKAK